MIVRMNYLSSGMNHMVGLVNDIDINLNSIKEHQNISTISFTVNTFKIGMVGAGIFPLLFDLA